jgi:hypothetical protein
VLGKKKVLVQIALAAAMASMIPPSLASASTRVENGGDVPFYARITTIGTPDQIYQDGEWAAIVFYRPPACVPNAFNLLDFFDIPGAFSCGPPTTEGFAVWRSGPGKDPAPRQAVNRGLGAVPVWFVRSSELAAAISDGVLTIVELEAMPSLMVGSASFFRQTLHPHGGANVPKTQFVASGELEDGRSFRVQAVFIEGVRIQTRITFR